MLRRRGEKIAREDILAHPTPGWLYLGPDERKHFPMTVARLFKSATDRTDVMEPLTYASVKSIMKGGLLIIGSEEVRSSVTQRQTWFCIPGPMDDTTVPGYVG